MTKQRFTEADLNRMGMYENPEKPGEYIAIKRRQKGMSGINKSMVEHTNKVAFNNQVFKSKHLLIAFDLDPIGKPRMTQSDKWKKRPATSSYWIYKDQLKKIAEGLDFQLPDTYHIVCLMPMPDSWSKDKKAAYFLTPHQQKPDKDNIEKGIMDALLKQDSTVWDGRVTKMWAYKGRIEIYQL